MQRKTRFKIALVLAVPLCLALVTVGYALWTDPPTKLEIAKYIRNAWRGVSLPQWQIFEEFSCKSVPWQDWSGNMRFAVYDVGDDTDPTNDLVLDKSTGLVWTRNTSLGGQTMTWKEGRDYCRSLSVSNEIMGFRLPAIEEMYTLFKTGNFVGGTSGLWVNVPTTDGWWTASYDPDWFTTAKIPLDEEAATVVPLGSWTYSSGVPGAYNGDQATIDAGIGDNTVSFVPKKGLPAGDYNVYAWWAGSGSGAPDAKYTVHYPGPATDTVIVDQQVPSNMWHLLGEYTINYDGGGIHVTLSDNAYSGVVMADAVKIECINCPPEPTAIYKEPAAASTPGTASISVPKYIWAVRGGSNMLGPQPEIPD